MESINVLSPVDATYEQAVMVTKFSPVPVSPGHESASTSPAEPRGSKSPSVGQRPSGSPEPQVPEVRVSGYTEHLLEPICMRCIYHISDETLGMVSFFF
jgi:hypothetical protein